MERFRHLADTQDPSGRRPVMTPLNQLSDLFLRAFSDDFDRPFAPVPDKTVNAQVLRFSAGALSEPHALHTPLNNEPHSDVVHSPSLQNL